MGGNPAICVLGSITADAVFRMARFPAPGETLFADEAGLFPGGKGLNQAIAAARLGARASLVGRVGNDAFAAMLLAAAEADGIDATHVRRGDGATGLAVPIVVPGGENAILAAPGANLALTVADVDAAAPAIEAADAFLVQFETPLETVARALEIARAAGVRTLLNPAPVRSFDTASLRLVDVLVLNEVEAGMLAGEAPEERQVSALLAMGPAAVVLTLGRRGGLWATKGAGGEFAAFDVEAVDTVGAGDCFCGALAVALCEGGALPEALRFAAAAAALSVTAPGAAPSFPRRRAVTGLLGD